MSILGGLGALGGAVTGAFGSSKGRTNETGSETTSGSQHQTTIGSSSSELLQQIEELLRQQSVMQQQQQGQVSGSEQTSGTQQTTTLDAQQRAQMNLAIQDALGKLQGENPYSQENAIAASEGALQAAIQEVMRSGIGNVAAQGTNFGAYGGTVQGKMASQLGADAASAGQKAQLDAITNFAGLSNHRDQILNNAIQGLLDTATRQGTTTTTDMTTSTDQTSNQSTTGSESTTTDKTGSSSQIGTETSSQDVITDVESTTDYSKQGKSSSRNKLF